MLMDDVQWVNVAYFWNLETGATSWRMPEGVETDWAAQTRVREGSSESEVYFWNVRTGQRTWEPPLPNRGRGTAAPGSGSSPAWCFLADDRFSGPSCDRGNAPLAQPPFYEAGGGVRIEDGEWVEVFDQGSGSSGRNYFVNFKAGVSTWNLKLGAAPTWHAYQRHTGAWYYKHVLSGEEVSEVADMILKNVEETEEDGPHARWIQFGAGMMIQGCSSRMSRFNDQVGRVLGRARGGRVVF